jgi:DNA-binding transcriptional regulator YhcF (GntR family)
VNLTPRESQVVQLLRQRQVAAYAELARQLKVSPKTVQRALHKAGAYASLNGNSAYVTLKNTPRFDRRGLWVYRRLRFSRHGDLSHTIRTLIEQSSQGCTVEELQQWLGTRVHNHLSLLLRRGEIQRFSLGRHVVYTSTDPAKHQQQQAARLPPPAAGLLPPAARQSPALPPGMEPMPLIRLLLQMLQKPGASTASLAKSLQAQGLDIHAEQVRQVMVFYDLKKTTP